MSVSFTTGWLAVREVLLETTNLKAGISKDAPILRTAFRFTDPLYSVAISEGTVTATFSSGQMEVDGWFRKLQQSGHIR